MGKIVVFVMHHTCNCSCVYCGNSELMCNDTQFFNKYNDGNYISAFGKLGEDNTFILSGGEPFITPHIKEFVWKLIQKNNRLAAYSNLLSDVKWLGEHADKIDYIMASLTTNCDTSEAIFNQYKENVEYLHDRGVKVIVRFVATRERIGLVEKHAEYFKSRGINFIVYPEFKYLEGPTVVADYTTEEKNIILKYSNFVGKINLLHFGIKGDKLKCSAGKSTIYIQPNGLVTPCCSYSKPSMGNIYLGVGSSEVKDRCGTICSSDIYYFYGINGLSRVDPTDTSLEHYLSWASENKIADRWFR